MGKHDENYTALVACQDSGEVSAFLGSLTTRELWKLLDLMHVEQADGRKGMIRQLESEAGTWLTNRQAETATPALARAGGKREPVMTAELVTLASATLSDVFTPDGTAVVVDAVHGDRVVTSDGETYRVCELTPSRGLLAIMETETASAMTTAVITTAVANTPRHAVRDIVAVAYGQFVAAYPLDLESQAKAVFVTAIGANVDATLFYMTYQEWSDARAKLPTNVTVFDRTSAADAIIRERA